MNLVTGYRGYAHVTSSDQAALHRAIFGTVHCIIDTGNVFRATFSDTGVLRIADGEAIIQGHHVRIAPGDYDEIELTAGTAGNNRLDYIAIRYTKDAAGVEDAKVVQICGTPTTGSASAPTLRQQDTSEFGSVYELPLYTITFTGLSIGTPVAVFTAIPDIQTQIKKAADETNTKITNLNKSKQNNISGGASTVTEKNLIGNRALVSDSKGKIAVSAATATELAYLKGLNSNAQSQFNALKNVLWGIGRFYFTSAAANLSSKWEWQLKKFDTKADISAGYGNLKSKVTGGYWIPPATGFFIAQFIITFPSNNKGARGARMVVVDSSNTPVESLATEIVGAIGHNQAITITAAGALPADRKLGLQVAQDSGTTLAVSATARVLWIPNL